MFLNLPEIWVDCPLLQFKDSHICVSLVKVFPLGQSKTWLKVWRDTWVWFGVFFPFNLQRSLPVGCSMDWRAEMQSYKKIRVRAAEALVAARPRASPQSWRRWHSGCHYLQTHPAIFSPGERRWTYALFSGRAWLDHPSGLFGYPLASEFSPARFCTLEVALVVLFFVLFLNKKQTWFYMVGVGLHFFFQWH